MNEKIIIIQDEVDIRRLLEVSLKSHGYAVMGFDNVSDAFCEMNKKIPDLIIIDTDIKNDDGIDAVKFMRQSEQYRRIPIIILTKKDSEFDKIEGLDSGADDYITIPFSVFELFARIRVQLRRMREFSLINIEPPVYESDGLRLDTKAHIVSLSGSVVDLTFKEFELLRSLMENKDMVLSREHLLTQIWGGNKHGDSRTLDIHIGTLRQKLGDTAIKSRYIKTVRNFGYRFVGRCYSEI